jgi:hypothetical protein
LLGFGDGHDERRAVILLWLELRGVRCKLEGMLARWPFIPTVQASLLAENFGGCVVCLRCQPTQYIAPVRLKAEFQKASAVSRWNHCDTLHDKPELVERLSCYVTAHYRFKIGEF